VSAAHLGTRSCYNSRPSAHSPSLRRATMSKAMLVVVLAICGSAVAQPGSRTGLLSSLLEPQNYVQKRVSSYDRSGGNADFREIPPGETLTLLNESGPGLITHIWITIASGEQYHLKNWFCECIGTMNRPQVWKLRSGIFSVWVSETISFTNPSIDPLSGGF
jgi:hypothetical protein